MEAERLFTMSDPENRYSDQRIFTLLREAERQGYPMEPGSCLEGMTFRQLDALLHGRTDC